LLSPSLSLYTLSSLFFFLISTSFFILIFRKKAPATYGSVGFTYKDEDGDGEAEDDDEGDSEDDDDEEDSEEEKELETYEGIFTSDSCKFFKHRNSKIFRPGQI
jgi:hypothetical protein